MPTTVRHRDHVPDILDCLAQLSNDEVPTPPKLARAMLDVLPAEVWSNPDYKWLDPGCKSGVFLREIATRLLEGLADWQPDFVKRREHIFRHMLYGSSVTEMTGQIARRSVYCSRDASSEHSAVRFDSEAGNIAFVPTDHTFKHGRCTVCGAPEDLERGDKRENYAYAFIHGTYPTKEMSAMKFDVIVGNPPYQIDSDGNTRTKPIYQLFVERAIQAKPRYVLMITPSRWFTGGLGLDEYRRSMVPDRRIKTLVDNPKLFDCFPGVEIKGGVSYFLWDREYNGDCEFSTRIDGTVVSTMQRDLRRGKGVLVRSNEADAIIKKVEALSEDSLASTVSSQKPFGLLSNFRGYSDKAVDGWLRLYKRGRAEAWVAPDVITQGKALIPSIKVLAPEAGDGHGRIPAIVTGQPFVVPGNSVCTQTFLVIDTFGDIDQAENLAGYLRTKFVRFLIHQRKVSQHTTSDTYLFVPRVPFDKAWTDEMLYSRYGLTADEVAVIESQIREMPAAGVDMGGDE